MKVGDYVTGDSGYTFDPIVEGVVMGVESGLVLVHVIRACSIAEQKQADLQSSWTYRSSEVKVIKAAIHKRRLRLHRVRATDTMKPRKTSPLDGYKNTYEDFESHTRHDTSVDRPSWRDRGSRAVDVLVENLSKLIRRTRR